MSPPAPRPVLEQGLPEGTHSHAGHPTPQPLATSCCWAGRGQRRLPQGHAEHGDDMQGPEPASAPAWGLDLSGGKRTESGK